MTISQAAGSTAYDAHAAAPAAPRKRWSRRVAADLVGFMDIAAIVAGAILPAFIYAKAGGLVTNWLNVVQTGFVTAMIAYGCLRNWRMYDTTEMHDFPTKPATLLAGLGVAFLAVLGLGIPFKIGTAHLWVWYAVWASASFTLLLANRIAARAILARMTAAGRFDTRVAVFGAGAIARRVHDHLVNPALGIKFAGVYDDRAGESRLNPEGLTVRGRLEDLIAAGLRGEYDQVIVALPQAADRRAAEIARKLEQLPVSLHVVTHIESDLVETPSVHSVSNLGAVGLLDVKKRPLSDWAPIVKQAEDYVLAGLAMVIALPVMALVAIAVRLDSSGPVLFTQRRRGLNQRVIEVLKFRTMTVTEDGADVRQAAVGDPRVTRVGRFLRRFSLDELPQLFNVLKGEMSLVGPRPHALVHDEQWGEMLEGYANRHQVKPGLTGLAQVAGLRGEASSPDKIRHRVEHDLEYIRQWSLGLDLRILARTVWTVIKGDNAH
jgi:putative colanic acid biosynthesis UDP-glucose lipid carrier transferase